MEAPRQEPPKPSPAVRSLRIFCAIVGLLGAAASAAGVAYIFNPAITLEPQPGFMVSVAVIGFLIALRFLWWAFAPEKLLHRRRRPKV